MPNSTILLARLEIVNQNLDKYDAIVKKARRGAMGLTLGEDKTDEWREAKIQWGKYWSELRSINQRLNKIRKAIGFQIVEGKRVTIYTYKS